MNATIATSNGVSPLGSALWRKVNKYWYTAGSSPVLWCHALQTLPICLCVWVWEFCARVCYLGERSVWLLSRNKQAMDEDMGKLKKMRPYMIARAPVAPAAFTIQFGFSISVWWAYHAVSLLHTRARIAHQGYHRARLQEQDKPFVYFQ